MAEFYTDSNTQALHAGMENLADDCPIAERGRGVKTNSCGVTGIKTIQGRMA